MTLASEVSMSKRRVMAKVKVYGFSLWVDEVDARRESKSLKGNTFAQISPLLLEKFKKERRESE
jgi:CRISPR/Cas system endoribonuclease Cas6 (RAMP superfamily)